jgi:thioredoxin-dependent peroxiredoxin
VAAGHRFKLANTTPYRCHQRAIGPPASQPQGNHGPFTVVFMTSSDFVVTLYSFGLDGNPTKLVHRFLPFLTFVYFPFPLEASLMALRLGDIAPDFEQESSEGRIRFHDWLGEGWGVLFSHPADYTPVCTTELGLTAKLKEEFAKRNVKAIALSVDSVASHKGWIQDINETQSTSVNFPILADSDRKVSELYDMIHPNANETLTVRSLFVIDPKKKVRLIITYPASTGRNFNEILRVIDSLQLTDHHSVATPGNWQDGDDVVIVPSLKDEEVIRQKFPKGYKAVRPYLRLTPQPNK